MGLQGAIDIFCLAHALGWFGKAMILRDYWFCWVFPIYLPLDLRTYLSFLDSEHRIRIGGV